MIKNFMVKIRERKIALICMSLIVSFSSLIPSYRATYDNHLTIHNRPLFADTLLEYDMPISTDSRIKTLIYSENEVFPVILNYGYQTSIDFAKGESIQTYSVGNNYAWQFSIIGRTMFIKPLEENIVTNMTVITNKRRYYFELVSKSIVGAMDADMAYAIRFFYPEDNLGAVKAGSSNNNIRGGNFEQQKVDLSPVNPYNFGYKISGDKEISPRLVFDDGINTYFQYATAPVFVPIISSASGGKNLYVRQIGNYFMVNEIGSGFNLVNGKSKASVIAEGRR